MTAEVVTLLDRLCASADPEVWFPEKGASPRDAKRVCGRCGDKVTCLVFALDRREQYGVWGGASHRDRRALLHRWNALHGDPLAQLALAAEWAALTPDALYAVVKEIKAELQAAGVTIDDESAEESADDAVDESVEALAA